MFIMADIGWMQPGIYHQGLAVSETPNIDRIAQEGAKFKCHRSRSSVALAQRSMSTTRAVNRS